MGKEKKAQAKQNSGIVKVAEATVFALFGLLVAFTFAGAYDRFENRKIKIISEVNAFETAYHRVSLLKPSVQDSMRLALKKYLDERIITYHKLAEFTGFEEELVKFSKLQDVVWSQSIDAVNLTKSHEATLLFIPAINKMFEIANERIMLTRVHPPSPIFILLIGLAAISSFLAGYNMARNQTYNVIYILCFTAITAFIIYVIINLEFPRIGLIRLDAFDHLLVETRNNL